MRVLFLYRRWDDNGNLQCIHNVGIVSGGAKPSSQPLWWKGMAIAFKSGVFDGRDLKLRLTNTMQTHLEAVKPSPLLLLLPSPFLDRELWRHNLKNYFFWCSKCILGMVLCLIFFKNIHLKRFYILLFGATSSSARKTMQGHNLFSVSLSLF